MNFFYFSFLWVFFSVLDANLVKYVSRWNSISNSIECEKYCKRAKWVEDMIYFCVLGSPHLTNWSIFVFVFNFFWNQVNWMSFILHLKNKNLKRRNFLSLDLILWYFHMLFVPRIGWVLSCCLWFGRILKSRFGLKVFIAESVDLIAMSTLLRIFCGKTVKLGFVSVFDMYKLA